MRPVDIKGNAQVFIDPRSGAQNRSYPEPCFVERVVHRVGPCDRSGAPIIVRQVGANEILGLREQQDA